jgi:thiol-disulfide isomerase/thioredoxin
MKWVLALLMIAVMVLVSGCASPGNGTIYIDIGYVIPDEACAARGINDRVLVIHKTGCTACDTALPKLMEAEQELNMSFEYINTAEAGGIERLEELGIMPYRVPTVLIKCKAYAVKTKDEYKTLIA